MMKHSTLLLTIAITISTPLTAARDIPANIQAFYDKVTTQSQCDETLASGFTSISGEDDSFSYCSSNFTSSSSSAIYIRGPAPALTNMDVCCDGIPADESPADDGRCETDPTYLSITAFQYLVEGYGTGQRDLDANVHPYVVFGNTAEEGNEGWPTFDPQAYGIEPLSLMAVVCGDKLIYGVWGDMNGDDGDAAFVGEASLSLATACYGTDMNGNHGYNGNDVLYIGFPGQDAVPGADGAAWTAQSYDEFEESIVGFGDRLIERIQSSSGSTEEEEEEDARSNMGGGDEESGSVRTRRMPFGTKGLRRWFE